MKSLFKPATLKYLLFLLGALLVLKLIWFVLEVLFLPSQGIDQPKEEEGKALYYRVKLTPNDAPPPKKVQIQTPTKIKSDIRDIKLLAIYHASDETVVTLTYKGKTKVLSKGEEVGGYTLVGAQRNYAIFSRNDKTYKVPLTTQKGTPAFASHYKGVAGTIDAQKIGGGKKGEVVDAGDRKIIDRSLIDYYTKNFNAIAKDIGISEQRNGEVMDGFKVNFIRRGSDFEKLGLKRDDVIKAVNGQPIRSYKAAMDVYRKVGDMENMTLTINRGNEEMELEYEVN